MVPRIRGATPALRNRLIGRTHFSPEDQATRERAVHAAGAAAARGEGPCRPLNSDWDHNFLGMLARRDWGAIDALTAAQVERDAGAGANEVLAWVAAAAATAAAGGNYEVAHQTYQAIPGWIAGMAMVAARV